jgi:hypothetical protein
MLFRLSDLIHQSFKRRGDLESEKREVLRRVSNLMKKGVAPAEQSEGRRYVRLEGSY